MFGIIQAAVLIGVGMCIESPNKRAMVFKALNQAGQYVEKSAGNLFQGGQLNPGVVDADDEDYR